MSQKLCRCCCPNTNILVCVLVTLFGVASWVDINGLWVELPILVQHLPEGWDLPSYMAVIIQVANVAPLIYTITSSIWPHRRIEIPVIYVIISVGAVSCLLLALFWDRTSSVAGTEHSTALFILQFFLALVDCTSSVAFLPFMSIFKSQYMIAYFIGEGFSGLIPSLVSLGQGAGSMKCVKPSWSNNGTISQNSTSYNVSDVRTALDLLNGTSFVSQVEIGLNASSMVLDGTTPSTTAVAAIALSYPVYQPPRFTVQTFFLFLMGLMIVSLISFALLNYWSYCKKEYVTINFYEIEDAEISSWHDQDDDDNGSEADMTSLTITPMTTNYLDFTEVEIIEISSNPSPPKNMTRLVRDNDDGSTGTRTKIYSPNNRGRNAQCCSGKFRRSNSKTNKNDSRSARGPASVRNSSSTSTSLSYVGSSTIGSSDLDEIKVEMKKISYSKYALYLILIAWINALVCGVLPSIQTYSCLPYGIRPYHLSVTLASISNPVACFAALFVKMTSTKATVCMTFLGSLLSGYLVLTAATSPTPPLVDHYGGGLLVILSWVIVIFFLTYTKVSIGMVFRKEGRRALLWVGAFTQVGALLGALAIFFIINYYHLFQWANPCA